MQTFKMKRIKSGVFINKKGRTTNWENKLRTRKCKGEKRQPGKKNEIKYLKKKKKITMKAYFLFPFRFIIAVNK